jgi:hypothetical protein
MITSYERKQIKADMEAQGAAIERRNKVLSDLYYEELEAKAKSLQAAVECGQCDPDAAHDEIVRSALVSQMQRKDGTK